MQQQANSGAQERKVAIVTENAARQSDGLMEIAILALAGLAVTIILIAHGIGPDAGQLVLGQ
jgi:hypothetical protein